MILELDILSLCVGVAIRSTFLAMVCAALNWLLHSRPAEIRHALWRGMLVAYCCSRFSILMLPPVRMRLRR